MAETDKSRFTQVMVVMVVFVLLAILVVLVFPRHSTSDGGAASEMTQAPSTADNITVVHLTQSNRARATNNWVVAILDPAPPLETQSPETATNLQVHVKTPAGEHLAIYASSPELSPAAETVLVGTVRSSSTNLKGTHGRVTLRGTAPTPATITDVVCGPADKRTIASRQYRVGPHGGLADVLVYIKSGSGVNGKTFEPPANSPVLDQVNCEYEPFFMGVMAGQRFQVKKSDPVLHNVNFSRASNNKGKNFAQAHQGMISEIVFDKSEVPILFKCDVHPWMTAYVAVLDNPYFAVTTDEGRFHIPDVPPGTYQLLVYHRKIHGNSSEGESHDVVVMDGKPLELAFALEVRPQ
jgi:hypothetical protein